ncbi:MAG TPA: ABC transporter substrate-binding protein [Anaerolineaceae bacterium]|nr:ABC transporter substrate-binding protein [Anaerolineaceae bacterium]
MATRQPQISLLRKSHRKNMLKSKLSISALILMLLAVACSPATPTAQSTPTTLATSALAAIRLPVGYIPDVQFAPLYVAMQKGYFQQEGINLTMDYNTETDAVALVGANKLQFAIASGEQVLLGRAQGLPVVYVAGWFQQYPVGVASSTSLGIQKPADLKGKKIGIPLLSGASYIGLRALLDAGGLKESDVTLDVIGFNQVQALAAGQEQAIVVYDNNEPIQLKSKGYAVNVLRVGDYLQLVGNGLITNETALKEHPELVRSMVKALLEGISYTMAHPVEAYSISTQYVENLAKADTSVQKQILATSIDLWKTNQLGYTDPKAWSNMQDILLKMGLLKQPLDLTRAFSNEYLPQQP